LIALESVIGLYKAKAKNTALSRVVRWKKKKKKKKKKKRAY